MTEDQKDEGRLGIGRGGEIQSTITSARPSPGKGLHARSAEPKEALQPVRNMPAQRSPLPPAVERDVSDEESHHGLGGASRDDAQQSTDKATGETSPTEHHQQQPPPSLASEEDPSPTGAADVADGSNGEHHKKIVEMTMDRWRRLNSEAKTATKQKVRSSVDPFYSVSRSPNLKSKEAGDSDACTATEDSSREMNEASVPLKEDEPLAEPVQQLPEDTNTATEDSSRETNQASVPLKEDEPLPESVQQLPEDTKVESITVYTGPRLLLYESMAEESNYTEIWNCPTEQQVTRVRRLVQKKRKRSCTDVEYDPTAWELVDGRWHPRKKREVDSSAKQEFISMPASHGEEEEWIEEAVATRAHQQPAPATPVRTRTRGIGQLKQDDEARIRVGDEYQATYLPDSLTHAKTEKRRAETAEMLWDPTRAAAAQERGEDIDGFLARGEDAELNITMLLMEALHRSNYRVKEAQQEFFRLFQQNHNIQNQNTTVRFSDQETDTFRELLGSLFSKEKDFGAIASGMNRRTDAVLVNYYNWKGNRRTRSEYVRLKRERKKDSDWCAVCDDGGSLLVCELCRNGFHLDCLDPPLSRIPRGDWYCPDCQHKSPCKLRRLSVGGGHRLDTSDHTTPRKPAAAPAARDASLSALRASLLSIHKEFTPKSTRPVVVSAPGGKCPKPAPYRPSGMAWDTEQGAWVTCGPESPAKPSAGEMLAVVKEDTSSVAAPEIDEASAGSPTSGTDDNSSSSSSESSTSQKKGDSVITLSSDSGDDSSFHEEDVDSDEDLKVDEFPGKSAHRRSEKIHSSPAGPNSLGLSSSGVRVQEYLYEVRIPFTAEGLLIHVSAPDGGCARFSGYRRAKSGAQGPAEVFKAFAAVGDRFIQIDGTQNCQTRPYLEVVELLKSRRPLQTHKVLVMGHLGTMPPANNGFRRVITSRSNIPKSNRTTASGSFASGGLDGSENGQRVGGTNVSGTGAASGTTTGAKPASGNSASKGQAGSRTTSFAPQWGAPNASDHTHPGAPKARSPYQLATAHATQPGPRTGVAWASHGPPPSSVRAAPPATVAPQAPSREAQSLPLHTLTQSDEAFGELVVFAGSLGIHTMEDFLSRNSSYLATEYARATGKPLDVALEYFFAARYKVRQLSEWPMQMR
jgi:hypothetical protein